MVRHSHLSAGNSESTQSRNLFVEFGISQPNSPSFSSPLGFSCDDMGESDPIPSVVALSSDDSIALDKALEVNVGPVLGSDAQDIFRAAHYFSSKDRDEALLERKKVMQLMDFISAHGLSVNDVNAFVAEGKLATVSHARRVFDKSSPLIDESPNSRDAIISSPSFLGEIWSQLLV